MQLFSIIAGGVLAIVIGIFVILKLQGESDSIMARRISVRNGIDVSTQQMNPNPPIILQDPMKGTLLVDGNRNAVCALKLTNMGTGETYTYTISKRLKIGRSRPPKNKSDVLYLPKDLNVSREHCMLYLHGKELFIKDLDSKCHTFVNDVQVENDTAVHNGDVIRVGYTLLKLQYAIQ